MNSSTSRTIALSVLQALFRPKDVRLLSQVNGIVLCGYPGSGKSTIAGLLHQAFGYEIFSTDQIRTEEFFPGQEHRMAKEHDRVMLARHLIYEELAKRAHRALNGRRKIVVDGTNLDMKRLAVLGAMLTKLPTEKVAMIVIRTPEWIIKSRFIAWSEQRYDEWWSVYSYWKRYVKEKKAGFPTIKELPRITFIKPKRYAISTFDWVAGIKGIVWNMNANLFRDSGWGMFSQSWGSSSGTRTRKLFSVLRQLRHFLFTDLGYEQVQEYLSRIGLPQRSFSSLTSYEQLHIAKADPKAFRMLTRLTELRPQALLSVGDDEASDIIPAAQAGMRTCLVYGRSRIADASLSDHYEVAELFGKEV